ncbi:S41 family peptidase [Aquimarina aquimarini]|uniref:S41 family peptidase n=1 Tax=Aquimarina aquimarini TaxID=1191734 RepID=UPI000D554E44|nr:S41 family peptidase [Aquimarina aquimarini]
MKKIQSIVLFCIFNCVLYAQKPMDSLSSREDFEIFENILKKGHPNLYEYIDSDSLNYIFNTTKESISSKQSDIDLYKKMLTITDKIKDGHLLLFAPNSIKTDQYYFPLILKIIHTDLYTDTNDYGIPIGSKINRINGEKASIILDNLKKYVSCDGYNLTKKYRDIELRFGLFYGYEYGISKQFDIDYTEPTGATKSNTIAAESFIKVKHRNTKRNSYFAKYHNKENGFDFFNTYVGNKTPFVHYNKELNTAVLVINSFKSDVRLFKSKLLTIFKEINKKKIKNLVIDIRHNDGGFRSNAVHLYSFITSSIFKQFTSEYVASLSVPERKYATQTFLNEKEFLKDKFYHHPIYDGWKLDFDDMEVIMVPDRNRFQGNIYVLAGGTTFDAGAIFALNIKNNPKITLIGEETGGGYYTHNGGFIIYYELPNSKISMVLPMEKISHYVKDTTIPKGLGIPPDKHIIYTLDDLIEGKDPELDYVFRLIRG